MIVVLGSLNMDLVTRVSRLPMKGETLTALGFHTVPGGKGANQALAAARLGADVRMIGRVGRDAYGEMLLANLCADGADVSHVVLDSSAPTGMAFITVDTAGANTIVVYPGANAHCSEEDVDACRSLISGARVLIAQLEIPVETVEYAFELARASSVMTILNPAPARKLPAALLASTDLLIPNEVEAGLLSGMPVSDPDSALRAAAHLREQGPARVVITLGSKGAIYAGPEGTIHGHAFRVQAVDSTAAGDAFIGAWAAAWTRGAAISESLRYASAAGAAATTTVGAQSSLPRPEQVLALLEQRSPSD
ncbi:MAG: ribokinase [Firmicutes bacterium]|jgi:ribokinase|nr:ribokinase [Bacillota bacterium]